MPTYEYACTSCGQHVEAVQSFSDDPLTTCPSCGGTLRKVFAPVGIVLKGSGFYKTDSRSSTNAGRSDGGGGDGSSSGADSAKDGSSAGKAEKTSDGVANGSGGSGSKESKPGASSGKSSAGNSSPAAASS
jgi:putative FmdB family regulatory protein